MDVLSISHNVNFVDIKIEGKQVDYVEEETNFLEVPSMWIPFEINKFSKRLWGKNCILF